MARKTLWTKEKIKAGFDTFRRERGRLPTAPEIDTLDYLPSSRLIQQKFVGLESLRFSLGYDECHFGKGDYRSKIANLVNNRGRDSERKLENILRVRFGEVFVHTKKTFGNTKNRVDFVYSPSGNFGVDVFYPETLQSMQNNVNIKVPKYRDFDEKLYLVVSNPNIEQTELYKYLLHKKKPHPRNIVFLTLASFLIKLENLKAYPNPLS